jgi:hypothetical protein
MNSKNISILSWGILIASIIAGCTSQSVVQPETPEKVIGQTNECIKQYNILDKFGVDKDQISIVSSDCKIFEHRYGNIVDTFKARIKDNSNNEYNLFYQMGNHCIRGPYCGFTKCISSKTGSNKQLFQTTKNKICDELEESVIVNGEEMNVDNQSDECFAGKFNKIIDNGVLISVNHDHGEHHYGNPIITQFVETNDCLDIG